MNRRHPLAYACLIGALASGSAAQASTYFDFTGADSSNLGNSINLISNDGQFTATITASRNGATSGVSAFSLDGLGVAAGGYRSIQGNETLTITFSQALNIDTLHLRQWEGPDEAGAVVTFNGGTNSYTISADTGGAFNTNEYVALNATGVTSMEINGIYNGKIFGIEKTQFFVAGLQGVSATPSEVPVPAAAWLFGSALVGLGQLARRRR